jgi:hypothetical protein
VGQLCHRFNETNLVELKLDDGLGLVRVLGTGLPKPQRVYLVPVNGLEPYDLESHFNQACRAFGIDMPVAAGFYDVRFDPADTGRSERLVEKLEVKPGKVTVVE